MMTMTKVNQSHVLLSLDEFPLSYLNQISLSKVLRKHKVI